MPIRMVDDDPQDDRNNRPEQNNRGGGGGGSFLGGGLSNILMMALPFLLRNPKILVPALLIGGAVYFFKGGCGGASENGAFSSSMGASLSEKEFDKAEVFEPLADNSKNPLPDQVSLEKYAPTRLNQGEQGSCVAWASSYAARTILHARATGQKPDDVRFSPAFLYNQIHLEDCQGAYVIKAMEFMKGQGLVPYNQFPYDPRSCDRQPSAQDKQLAEQYKTRGFNRLSVGGDNYKIDMLAIKQNLAQGAPVVIGMMVGGSFMEGMLGRKLWQPTEDDYQMYQFGGHAMCVIGYDDNLNGGAFQIMNSWGKEWGVNGIGYVRYKDFEFFVKEAYGLYPMGNAQQQAATFKCKFALFKPTNKAYVPFAQKSGNLFETTQPVAIGDKFKVEVTNNVDCYTYIFGEETDKTSYVLFPYTAKHSPYCGITGTRQFPKDKSLQPDNQGAKDYIAVLITKQPIDYKSMNFRINQAKGTTYQEKVNNALAGETVEGIRFTTGNEIGFETTNTQKNIVAIVLGVSKK